MRPWLYVGLVSAVIAWPIAMAQPAGAQSDAETEPDNRQADQATSEQQGDEAQSEREGTEKEASSEQKEGPQSPEEKMQARYPQPVRTGDLIGLPVHDEKDRIYGYVERVVRTPENKIELVVPYRAWFGWAPEFAFWPKRRVAVPIETVGIVGDHLNALDFARPDFDAAPTWTPAEGSAVPDDETIRVALAKR